MNDVKFNKGGKLTAWSYIVISHPGPHNPYDSKDPIEDITKFTKTLKRLGITGRESSPGRKLVLNSPDDPTLESLIRLAAANFNLLLVILPCAISPVYHRVKSLGDLTYGVHTVCVVASKLAKLQGQDQYFTNVALKFNLKFGGHNQLVDGSHLGIIDENKTMVVGIDVTHPSPGSAQAAPSIAGMVASIDKYVSQFPGIVRVQSQVRQEMVSATTEMLKSRLCLWKELGKHEAFPENILIYRDGVSEGQYQTVIDTELPLLRAACKELYPPADQKKGLPRLTIVIVSKRHHTRFYPSTIQDADRFSNNPAGTVVDRGVTESGAWDFYLQSHTAIQGTARPAHYFVVLDEIFRSRYSKGVPPGFRNVADVVESLSQALCYTYGRATKAVSICAPVYYADILCERARVYLRDVYEASPTASGAGSVTGGGAGHGPIGNDQVTPHERLENTMFYI